MTDPTGSELDDLWARHSADWREPAQIASQWEEAAATDTRLLRGRARGGFWDLVERKRVTLLVTREYEHLLMGLTVTGGRPQVSYMRMPHPSGVAVDEKRGVVHVASTRNPNQVYDLVPVTGTLSRRDVPVAPPAGRPLVPLRSRFHPGSLYIHDLAMVGGELHANAVGENAVVRLPGEGSWERVWWPRAIERRGRPDFTRNYLQLNSIAAGPDVSTSYFTASADRMSARRPGHRNFMVDRRGVLFDGATREPAAGGLTRPHSARLHQGTVWLDNSGYGELGIVHDGAYEAVARLPGWTRGLCLRDGVAWVATSKVIPSFRQYAPGLDVDRSRCAIHAVDLGSGEVLGSLTWPYGNQVFAVEALDRRLATGLPFPAGRRPSGQLRRLFYGFDTSARQR